MCEHDHSGNLTGQLLEAAGRGLVNCIAKLLEAGADVNTRGEREVESNADEHSSSAAKVNSEDRNNSKRNQVKKDRNVTALMLAAEKGYKKCVIKLISAGANINATNSDGITALFEAAYGGHRKCVYLLLKAGADVNLTDNKGKGHYTLQ